MADSFFGFDAKMPSLDGGKSFRLDSGGMLGLDGDMALDDKIDELNDETFGLAEDLDNWDHDEHVQLVDVLCMDQFNGGRKSDMPNGDMVPEQDLKSSLEQSLSQLVVDDEDELEDPAVMNASKHRPIPRKHNVDLNDLFGPSSPPGFLNTEHLVSPGRTNIWGSPSREGVPQPRMMHEGVSQPRSLQDDSCGSKLFHMLHKQQTMSGQALSHQGSSLPMSGQPMRMPPGGHEMTPRPTKPRVISVEELEREMRGETIPNHQGRAQQPPSPASSFPPPIGTPMPLHLLQQQMSPAGMFRRSSTGQLGPAPGFNPATAGLSQSANAGLTRKQSPTPDSVAQLQALRSLTPSPGSMPSPTYWHPQRVSPPLAHPLSPRIPLVRPGSPGAGRVSPVIPLPLPPMLLTSPAARSLLRSMLQSCSQAPTNHTTSSGSAVPSSMNFTPVTQRPPYSAGDPLGSHQRGTPNQPPTLNQTLFGQRGRPHNQYHQQRYQDSHQQRYQERGQSSFHPRGGRRGSHHHGNRQWQANDEDPQAGGDHDEYANLMTQKEKDWIIKIQLLQLHTDNPYVDDYYYTTWMMRKAMKEREKKVAEGHQRECRDTELQLLLPQLARHDNRSYKPVQFEGSLGRLTASSVHNPRQIIDVTVNKELAGEDAMTKMGRRFKQLLLEVEKCYDLLLEIDDIEKQALALPEDGRGDLLDERRKTIGKLFGQLSVYGASPEPFKLLASLRKGIRLVARSLPVLDRGQLCVLLGLLLRHLDAFMSRDGTKPEFCLFYSAVRRVLGVASLEMLVFLITSMQQGGGETGGETSVQYLETLIKHRFGCSCVWALVSRGETIYSTVSPVDMELDHHQAWLAFIKNVATATRNVPLDQLASPLPGSLQATRHMARLLDKKCYAAIEEHLLQLSAATAS